MSGLKLKEIQEEVFTPGDKLEFGHYTILKELGSGGMGVVFHCRDEFLQREIAIKMMLPELMAQRDIVDVFRQEARLAARLEHPHIVTIHNIGVENREDAVHHYIAMEYLPGGSLRSYVGKNVSLEQALEWMKQLASALHYAHKRGVIHQDIKPDNIFVTKEGNVKIGDFGLAKLATEAAFERHGTPAYMSPELCRGEARDLRSDIYSLGAVFFELLTGELPYKANDVVEMARKHASAPLPLASKIRTDLPSVIDRMLKLMLAKQPNDRLQSLGDLLGPLEKMLLQLKATRLGVNISDSGKTEKAAAEARATEPAEPTMDFRPAAESYPNESTNPSETRSDQVPAPEKKPVELSADKEKVLELLWTFKSKGPIGWLASPVLSKSRKQVYLSSADGTLYALDINTGGCIWYYETGAPLLAGALPSAEDVFVAVSDGSLHCLNAGTGKCRWKFQGSGPIVSPPVGNNEFVLVGALDGSLKCISIADGSVSWVYRCDKGIVCSPQILDDTVYVASKDRGVHAVELKTGARKWMTAANGSLLTSVLVSTDSVYFASSLGEIMAVDIGTGKDVWHYDGASPFLCRGNLEFSTLNYCTKDGSVICLDKFKGKLLWKADSTGAVLGGITGSSGAVYLANRSGVLHSFNSKTGDLNWFANFSCALESAPLVTSTNIFQGTVKGELIAYAVPVRAK